MPHLGKTKSGYPLGHTSPTIIAQMLTFVEHHPVGLFLWCQAQALLSLRQPLIDDSSSHGSPFRNFRNNSVIRSEEHTSELQSLMRISYAVFCLQKKNQSTAYTHQLLS